MCWRKVVVNLIPLHPHKPSLIQPCPNLWQNSYWLQMDLDRVYVLHDLQDVLAAWTNVHLFHCHLWHLANQLSPEIRQGLTGKCQGETWIVTAGAKHLLSHSLFSGDSPRAGLTCSLFTSQTKGCPNRELLLGSAGVGGTSYCPSLLYPARSSCPVAGGVQCWVFVCFLDR